MPIQPKLLRFRQTAEEFDVYRAALEWDLVDPILIEGPSDLKSEPRWRERLTPYHHQVTNLITFCRRLPVTLLADDVGLGKTISAGLIASELITRCRISKILVVCPKLLGPQWQEELLTKFNIESQVVTGRELIHADPDGVGAVITTYHSARNHLDAIPHDRFQMLVLDEAHKLRNLYGVENPPAVAKRFRNALEERRFRFVLMLTATPIHNRLWDLYSLVDLLTVARGHRNPFGSEGVFIRKFIADGRTQARKLRPEARDEFRSIVYSYMSRVRRGDAKLYFPERAVQMHKVVPTPGELALIAAIARPIQRLNRLAQISILVALASSPEALSAQLSHMADNGTVSRELALEVREIVRTMPTTAKLRGLAALVERLRAENKHGWRLIVFTCRLETQTTIQIYLESQGIRVGIINGQSGSKNQDTLARFREDPPGIHVIVSTEAGSEGVNLQVANVVVNYDLPWNPMTVEQRIGRVQRLASKFANVAIFNVILRGTFEEYIVGRLMEKLQMASHAIGDIESLLEASGLDGDDADESFEEQLRKLVVASLAGANVEEATKRAEDSIANAKSELEREEKHINEMLGSMDGREYIGPRVPKLPTTEHSLDSRDFVIHALTLLGARIVTDTQGGATVQRDGEVQHIRFDDESRTKGVLYAPGSPAFSRLVDHLVATGIHDVSDSDSDSEKLSKQVAERWVRDFGGTVTGVRVQDVFRCFEGKALVRARATVAHDAYERLIEVPCDHEEHRKRAGLPGLWPLAATIDNPSSVGIDAERIEATAALDPSISEFRRFYLERREEELKAAGTDDRKRQKLDAEFTPSLHLSLVALQGTLHREVVCQTTYSFDGVGHYENTLSVVPSQHGLFDPPGMAACVVSGRLVPVNCLLSCAISKANGLAHLMATSETSGRNGLPEFAVICDVSGKKILQDEGAISSVTGKFVAKTLLKTSALSRQQAEATHFIDCNFSGAEVLKSEAALSDISGMRYRRDQEARCEISGSKGHASEFVRCAVTSKQLAPTHSEKCEVTGQHACRSALQICDVSGKRVLPSELSRCAITGKRVLKDLLVRSSINQELALETSSVRSSRGLYCLPAESKLCVWSGKQLHPDDVRVCKLTGLPMHFQFMGSDAQPSLKPLEELLTGQQSTAEHSQLWPTFEHQIASVLGKRKCRIQSATLSPDSKTLAVCSEVRTLLGMRVQQAGVLYSIPDRQVIGRAVIGRRTEKGWKISD